MIKPLFDNAELATLDRSRQILASRKMTLLRELMDYDPESRTAYCLRKQCNAITKCLDNLPNWRQVIAETKEIY